ncbi:uncharacterized protein LOC126840723 [Adelges cooleyi]|uniref:uncharacterized protein LOC126840723 n=1 Tax=Adelges cooleyi TaxID=133065 RepID=UPI00217F2587|nr:uncharacterized protein LOC126840723 [Adelges cooleyi]
MSVSAFTVMASAMAAVRVVSTAPRPPAAAVASDWNVTEHYGLHGGVRLSDVVVWRNRAYACVPRLDGRQPVTLLELPWPEVADPTAAADPTRNWRPRKTFRADQQKLRHCQHVQSAVAVDLDKIRGHLYVLDAGYEECQPKVVVYGLKAFKTVQLAELGGANVSDMSTLAVDARPLKGETRVYIGSRRGGYITVFDPGEGGWHRISLSSLDGENEVPVEFLAVSKLQSLVYFTSALSHSLYSASLRDLRNLTSYVKPGVKSGDTIPGELPVRCEGTKLGISRGLYVDIQGGTNYVYARDFAAVRWTPSMGLSAEKHTVMLQSRDQLPAVVKICADNTYLQVWAINGKPNADHRYTVKINTLNF